MSSRLHLYHRIVTQFQTQVPGIRVTQLRGFSLLVLGVVLAQHVSLARIARSLPLAAHPTSTERRLRRLLANPRLPTGRIWTLLRRQVLTGPGPWRFVLDLTPVTAHQQMVCLGVVVGQRVIPLAVRCVPLRTSWPVALGPLWAGMVTEVAADLAPGSQVTLLADRGLVGPGIVTPCTNAGWSLVLRLKTGDTSRIRRADGTEWRLAELVAATSGRQQEPIWAFKKSGWIAGWLTIWPTPGQTEPWVLFSTQPGGAARVADYRCRMRIEATFQDLKRRGFQLRTSRLRHPERMVRLWLVLSWALWWLHQVGDRMIRRGTRAAVDRGDRRTMSRLQLGWHRVRTWWLWPSARLPHLPLAHAQPRPTPDCARGAARRAHHRPPRAVRPQSVRL